MRLGGLNPAVLNPCLFVYAVNFERQPCRDTMNILLNIQALVSNEGNFSITHGTANAANAK